MISNNQQHRKCKRGKNSKLQKTLDWVIDPANLSWIFISITILAFTAAVIVNSYKDSNHFRNNTTNSSLITCIGYIGSDIVTEQPPAEFISYAAPKRTIKEQLTLEEQLGNDEIILDDVTMIRHDLPDKYYPNIDFSSFQPFMCYTKVTNENAPAYDVVHSDNTYTDDYGLRRYKISDDQFSINGQDDYMIALGTFYKPEMVVGNRYLIVTTNGMYTATTGDEKSDMHTNETNMFSVHKNGQIGMIEWIVDWDKLNSDIQVSGTVTIGGPDVIKGQILYMYEIQ